MPQSSPPDGSTSPGLQPHPRHSTPPPNKNKTPTIHPTMLRPRIPIGSRETCPDFPRGTFLEVIRTEGMARVYKVPHKVLRNDGTFALHMPTHTDATSEHRAHTCSGSTPPPDTTVLTSVDLHRFVQQHKPCVVHVLHTTIRCLTVADPSTTPRGELH